MIFPTWGKVTFGHFMGELTPQMGKGCPQMDVSRFMRPGEKGSVPLNFLHIVVGRDSFPSLTDSARIARVGSIRIDLEVDGAQLGS